MNTKDFNEHIHRPRPFAEDDSAMRVIIEHALDAVICMDETGLVTEWNTQAEAIFGWSRAEAIGMPLVRIIPLRHREAHLHGLQRYLKSGEGPILDKRTELVGLRKDGEEFPLELAVAAITISGRHHFSAFVRDISDRYKSEQLLEAAASELQLVMDNVPALISYVDRNQVFRRVNRGYEEFFGRSREQLIGKTVHDVVGELHYSIARTNIERVLGGERVTFESRVKRRDGSVRDITLSYTPDLALDGTVRGFVVMVQDVTERRHADAELRRNEEQFRKVFFESPLGMALLGPGFRYNQVNPALCRMLGYEEAELLARTSLDVTHPEDRRLGVLEAEQVFRGERPDTDVEKRYVRKDGAVLWVRVHSCLFYDLHGQPWCNLVLVEDITARKQAESVLVAQAEALARSNTELQQFAYAVSHDLQEPLRSISGYSKLLLRRYKGELDADADEFLDYLDHGAQRMSALIRDLLQYARVADPERFSEEPVDLNQVMRSVLSNLESAIEDTNALVTVEPLPIVSGHRVQLLQLFQNLVSNALKYRTQEEAPRVRIRAERSGEL